MCSKLKYFNTDTIHMIDKYLGEYVNEIQKFTILIPFAASRV